MQALCLLGLDSCWYAKSFFPKFSCFSRVSHEPGHTLKLRAQKGSAGERWRGTGTNSLLLVLVFSNNSDIYVAGFPPPSAGLLLVLHWTRALSRTWCRVGREQGRCCARQNESLPLRLAGLAKHCESSKAAWDLKSSEWSRDNTSFTPAAALPKSLAVSM